MAISVSLNGENFEQVSYTKEDIFEQLVAKNAQTIFGDKAIYIDTKKKVNTSSLGGTIPDGFLVDMSDPDDPQFYLVEVELQSHDFFKHIFPQITRFFAFYRDSKQRHKLIETMFSFFQDDSALTKKLRDLIGSNEVYKFLKDTIDSNQNILIVIDGSKPEFEEIMDTYTDTWGKMVKVQIVNHFQRDNNYILTVEPPFQNIPFEDAISTLTEKEISEPSQYTEEFHLEGRGPVIKDMYIKLKNTFLSINAAVTFKPVKGSVRVWLANQRNIGQIYFRRNKLSVGYNRVPLNEANGILKHHRFRHHDQDYCVVEIFDTNHWEEIEKFIVRLVERHQES